MRVWAALGSALIAAGGSGACVESPQTATQRLAEARHLTADLEVQFARGGDAVNRAVMAGGEEATKGAIAEGEQAMQSLERNVATLRPLLAGLRYAAETRLLEEFATRFAAYRELDRRILELALENTNVKARRLSFGAAADAADAFAASIAALAPTASGDRRLRIQLIGATAVAAVREIQALQAPHIAEPEDAVMTALEGRMAAAEATARRSVEALPALVPPQSRAQAVAARTALDRFIALHAQILALSRRNTDVRSLALSLGQKRTLTAACEASLRALQDALAARGITATR